MRVLFIAPTVPIPANNGYKMRIWAFLRALAAEGHDIDLIAFELPEERGGDRRPLSKTCSRFTAVPLSLTSVSASADYRGRLQALVSGGSYGVVQYRSTAMHVQINSSLRDRPVDAILCATPFPLINIPDHLPAPLIVDDQNVEYLLLRRYLKYEMNPVKRAYAWLEYRRLRAWERFSCSRSDMVTVCSGYDRSVMLQFGGRAPIAVVPNIIDIDRYVVAPPAASPTLLYVGGMDYYPNRDAVRFFGDRVLPELRRMRPGVRFVVAFSPGRGPRNDLRRHFGSSPDVEFRETNEPLAEMAGAGVFVVPIRIGSGTRFKILEAAAMAKPIVSTRIGAEGLSLEDGREILLADEPQAFAHAVVRALDDSAIRLQLGAAARRKVEQCYTLEVLRAALRHALGALACGGSARGSAQAGDSIRLPEITV